MQVIKRSGQIEIFDPHKIKASLRQAIINSGLKDNPISDKFTLQVEAYLQTNYQGRDNDLPQVAKIYAKTRGQKINTQQKIFLEARKIVKRDGTIADFDKSRIWQALHKAGEASGEFNGEAARHLTDKVVEILEHKYNEQNLPTVEQVQDLIEIILIQNNWPKTVKAFILYREERRRARLEQGKTVTAPEVKDLENKNIFLSKQAKHILNNSQQFDELGRIIFLDRYSIKDKKETIELGDLVIAISKEDRKYPKKDLGIVQKIINRDEVIMHMLTGLYADPKNNFEFHQDLYKCDKPRESIDDAHRRIAKAVASVELLEENRIKYLEVFLEQLNKKHIQPAGRIMTGANVDHHGNYTSNLTLFNCYVVPSPRDSRKGIIRDTLYQMVEIMSRGGGVGMSLSGLRPHYAYVKGVHGKSSGSVSWGGLFSFVTGLIEQNRVDVAPT